MLTPEEQKTWLGEGDRVRLAKRFQSGVEAVDVDKPLGREVLVRTVATGVCHSDLHVVDGIGRFPLDRPIVLGHEGAGIVEAVGPDVTTVRPGDHVVACLSGFCGSCPQCLSGHPNLCTGGIVTLFSGVPLTVTQTSQTWGGATATIGVKSIGPAVTGMIRRQRRRYGSQTS